MIVRIVIFVSIVLGLVLTRPTTWISKTARDAYHVHKTFNPYKYDIVVVGDSRVEISVSPEILETKNPELKVLNFGYSAAGLTNFYLDLAINKLNKRGKKVLLVGVSPSSLTHKFGENQMLQECLDYSWYQKYKSLYLSSLLFFFDPIKPVDYIYDVMGIKKGRYENYTFDGWKKADKFPRDSIALIGYKDSFKGNPISQEILNNFFSFIYHSNQNGITIIAFRIPSIPEMWHLEDSLSGFDTLNIPARIKEAGGLWLDFKAEGYESFDASHMTPASTFKFSNQLADSLQLIFLNP